MIDPHLFPLEIENRAELKHANIFLAYTREGDYSLHVRIFEHGMHEDETLDLVLDLQECADECSLGGGGDEDCWWLGLGKKENSNAAAIIDATFERYKKYLDDVLKLTWDWQCAMRNIGHPYDLNRNSQG